MSTQTAQAVNGRPGVSTREWQTRCEVAAFHRLQAKYGLTDLVEGFVGARVDGEPSTFLVKPYERFPEEVCASDLIKFHMEGGALDGRGEEANEASIRMCSALLRARPADNVVFHTHTKATMAVGATKCGLLSLSQPAFMFFGRLAYSAFGYDADEAFCRRLITEFGDKRAMLMLNHGMMTIGRSAAEAFFLAYTLNDACEVQIAAQMTGMELNELPTAESEAIARSFERTDFYVYDGSRQWPGLIRKLNREDPSYLT